MSSVNAEPALVLSTIAAVLNGIQAAAIPMPGWAHALIIVLSTVLAGGLIRQRVSSASWPR